jgi:hypothetical protein
VTTTLQSKISVGGSNYTITELLKNMRNAFSKDEALRWAFFIQKSFIDLGYNSEIDKTMNEILASKEIPPIVVMTEECAESVLGMPEAFLNYIFKKEFDQEFLRELWCWIKKNFIDKISYPYQYLSLLLFLENHHSLLLQNSHISNTDMENQMLAWYSTQKVKCSADSLGTYRNGYFKSDDFRYVFWVNTNGNPPYGYNYQKDQSLTGFHALVRFCNNLELYLPELKL